MGVGLTLHVPFYGEKNVCVGMLGSSCLGTINLPSFFSPLGALPLLLKYMYRKEIIKPP